MRLQVAPFRNPIELPDPAPAGDVNQIRLPDFNNAWLRAVAYQLLFSFQAFGLSCFAVGAFGTQGLVGACAIAWVRAQLCRA
jgi:hypothetical protein